jgi:predicted enzyme related to lactoylglutathione lyase
VEHLKPAAELGRGKCNHLTMSDIDILFAGVPVRRFESAVDWYSRVFGRPADIVVTDDEVMWRFTESAWLYIIRDEDRAGRALVALCVSDLDRTLADISDRGITSGPVEAVGDSARKAVITDADGNDIGFIQVDASA